MVVLGPLSARAASETRTPRGDISIEWEGEFNRAHGVRSGKGTVLDPYVISGWALNNLRIKDTESAIKIINNTITGTLTLDWVGPNVVVHDNDVGDLRVNQNNARWGDPTGGHIMHNRFGQVGQLRHYDGMFASNTVGAPQTGMFKPKYPDTRAVNFDGFNGARFSGNTIYGFVEARLHGHHHGSQYGGGSHMHADGPHSRRADHTKRYHEVWIERNSIFSSAAYALAYLDTNHAGNDRTANSETNPWLNAPHTHFTRVHVTANKLFGAGLLVNVFNAQDERHTKTPNGSMEILRNTITLERDMTRPMKINPGIEVRQARYMALRIGANDVKGPAPITGIAQLDAIVAAGTGVLLSQLDRSTVLIDGQRISDYKIGIQGVNLSKTVRWTIKGLSTTRVQKDVQYDGSVANAPQRS